MTPRRAASPATAALAFATALALACGSAPDPQSLPADELQPGPLERTVLLSGEVRTAEAVELLAPLVGMWPIPIETIVADGTQVREGDAIAEFDNSNLVGQLDSARERVIQAQADLESARAKAAVAEADARFEVRTKEIALEKAGLEAGIPEELRAERDNARARLELDRARLELETARTQLDSQLSKSEAEIGIARVELDKARTELQRMEDSLEVVVLRAPRDGIVEVAYNRDEGRAYRSGDNAQPGQPVARFPNYDTLRVEAFLFDVDQGSVRVGAPVEVVLDAFPDRPFSGTVTGLQEVAQQPDPRSSRRTFRTIVSLDEPDPTLMRTGMSARVTVSSRTERWRDEPLRLARRATLDFVHDRPATEPGPLLARLGPEGPLVEVGPCSAEHCAVRDPAQDDPRHTGLRGFGPTGATTDAAAAEASP